MTILGTILIAGAWPAAPATGGYYFCGDYTQGDVFEVARSDSGVRALAAKAVDDLQLLPGGNRQFNDGGKVGEADIAGKKLWSLQPQSEVFGMPCLAPDHTVHFCASFELLDKGRILFTNWLGHGNQGKVPQLSEITHHKQVALTFHDHRPSKTINAIHLAP